MWTGAASLGGDGSAAGVGETDRTEGRELGTCMAADASETGASGLSGRPTARRFTTVGRMRSSTMEELFCFSM
jgi:hypothetical protein